VAAQARLKIASFHVRATEKQSLRWNRAAEAEGHRSVGTWLADAADRHLDAVARAGKPLPLAWNRFGRFRVRLEDGREVEVSGRTSPPFGIYRGGPTGPGTVGGRRHSLVFLPAARVLATMRTEHHCKGLAGELSRLWARWGGSEPVEDAARVVERFQREDT
jgi:hypothetical protein